ncbi:helix-turn-helix transcriptional regulator [Veillonella seminalis]|uniref:helix-turn-helix transcriptional regulator n=1 Tax=Veillonella seminalis TaxID=1502943 RepID=UPI0023F3614F|nr:helix-turn-helix transcriptional regulator [Veillonella seminalis]
MKPLIRYDEFKIALLDAGLSPFKLAERINCSKGTIYNVVNGKPCSFEMASRIAKELNVKVSEVFTV